MWRNDATVERGGTPIGKFTQGHKYEVSHVVVLLIGNIAYGKKARSPAAKSSDSAQKAIDGSLNPSLPNCFVADAPGEENWWVVELGILHPIYSVVIYNTLEDNDSTYFSYLTLYFVYTYFRYNTIIHRTT